jgi:hypothetical protein
MRKDQVKRIMELINVFTNNLVLLLAIIGVLAFLVSVITEVTKNIGALAKIPTDLEVVVLSIILCLLTYFTYASYFTIIIQWYYIVGCIIAAFIVAFISMYGWDKFTVLYYRFKYPIEKPPIDAGGVEDDEDEK